MIPFREIELANSEIYSDGNDLRGLVGDFAIRVIGTMWN